MAKDGLRIGEWTVEPALNRLSAGERVVKVEPKAMEVLTHLAARPGEVVSRDALLAEVWRGVVVGDDALTQVVIKLRKALGDGSESPSYIQTIPKRGYRLIAPVSAVRAAPQRRPWRLAAALIGFFLAGGTLYWAGKPDAERAQRAEAATPSISVRRFEPVGNDPESALLARGMTADLVADLSRLSGLAVIDAAAGSSAVDYVVTGTVQRAEGRVRVNVFLADARTGKQIWTERFDRERSNFFAIQEELGPRLVQTLPAKVSEEELRRIARPHTRNLEAYAHFQRGQAALGVRQKPENELARTAFQKAIALDASFARAYAALSMTYVWDFRSQWVGDDTGALARAHALAQTALQINPEIPEPYYALAFVHMHRRQHEEAIAQVQNALRLAPSYADGYALIAGVNTYVGRPAESVRLVRSALRLNPQGGHLYLMLLGRAYFFLGELAQARINLEQSLARNPENLETHLYLAAVLLAAGERDEAAWKAEEIRMLQPDFKAREWLRTYPMSDPAQIAKLEQALRQLGL
ncbi:MAG TPA: winged helix-turn-helix domain-containing protein [Burkholderiales bacterium]|nr:winged helix-turn-helix domain-containing protein [Burkholderiales bacterium]